MSNIKKFPLTCRDGRIALLVGITSGTVGDREVEAAVLNDIVKRPYRKPVVAADIYYDSAADAARAIIGRNVRGWNAHRRISNLARNISNWCTADNVEGYYWAEPK